MRTLTAGEQAILDAIDEELAKIARKLEKVQPLIDQRNQLQKTRATLLSERSPTGGIKSGTSVTMEQVIHAMREVGAPMEAPDIAKAIGSDNVPSVRAHLNRFKDERYRRVDDGWVLIGKKKEKE